MNDDRDFAWLGPKGAPAPADAPEHLLWTLTKRDHRVECHVRATAGGPEIRISFDGELWWSHVYKGATEEILTVESDRKREEFLEKGWS